MTIYAVTYVYHPSEDDARAQLRPEHREWLAAQEGLLLSGPTDDGALLIWEGASVAEVEESLDGDPFWAEDLVAERAVVEWKPVTGPWREPLGLD
ncbi:MAG: YciI family protein [Nocardioides sp.]|uniref:YciI family protein n=1 Tax=Nocardioides sp. TaxID=35761 RepID=UPI0039E43A79